MGILYWERMWRESSPDLYLGRGGGWLDHSPHNQHKMCTRPEFVSDLYPSFDATSVFGCLHEEGPERLFHTSVNTLIKYVCDDYALKVMRRDSSLILIDDDKSQRVSEKISHASSDYWEVFRGIDTKAHRSFIADCVTLDAGEHRYNPLFLKVNKYVTLSEYRDWLMKSRQLGPYLAVAHVRNCLMKGVHIGA